MVLIPHLVAAAIIAEWQNIDGWADSWLEGDAYQIVFKYNDLYVAEVDPVEMIGIFSSQDLPAIAEGPIPRWLNPEFLTRSES